MDPCFHRDRRKRGFGVRAIVIPESAPALIRDPETPDVRAWVPDIFAFAKIPG